MLLSLFITLLKAIFAVIALFAAYILYEVVIAVYDEWTSPFRNLPGPPSSNRFFGNMKELRDHDDAERGWIARYGRTIKVHRFLGQSALYTIDSKALHHVLTNTNVYQKSEGSRFGLGKIVGPGILVVEGDQHRQQRKIMNPAFGAPQVRALTSIFVDKSIQLRDIWISQIARGNGTAHVEALSWLSKATLDIIGLAGFNHNINALGTSEGGKQDELAEAFERVFAAETDFSLMRFLQMKFPPLRRLPNPTMTSVLEAQATMQRIGRRLLAESKREIAENGTFETGHGRDLLTLLVKANTSKDVPESQRLCDEDVIAQVPTFLVAGHETTSTAVTWALFALTQSPAVQSRLRAELLSVPTDTPTMDELNALPYLDCVVRETLRLYAPVAGTSRMAMKDDVIPVEAAYTDKDGVVHQSVRVKKGQMLFVPITALNTDTGVWGADALEFIPERWEKDLPRDIPGVWGHMMTFLGGPRSCIGFRFSLVETKAILFTLVRAFQFALAVPAADMGKRGNAIVERPIVKSQMEKGNQLPLVITPVENERKVGA
ncbi:cytochrome P450 [Mycena amicta]|nr:cytochrome P450 [Mycena amicta]